VQERIVSRKVVVAFIHNGSVSGRFAHSLLQVAFREYPERISGSIVLESGPRVASARNTCVHRFLALDPASAEWLWMVDADMTFGPDLLERLFEIADPVERPIVGGLAFSFHDELGTVPVMFKQVPQGLGRIDRFPRGRLLEVDATGAACLLVHRRVFESLREEYRGHWFQELVEDGKESGEDVTFCLRARRAGFKIHVHTGIDVGHVKPHICDYRSFVAEHATSRMALEELRFVVACARRSGAAHTAEMLTSAGIPCGYKAVFNSVHRALPAYAGDASWLSVPMLSTIKQRGQQLFHQVRHPVPVIDALVRHVMSGPRDNAFDVMRQVIPDLDGQKPVTDAMRCWVEWNRRIEAYEPALRWRVENFGAENLERIASHLGYDIPLSTLQWAASSTTSAVPFATGGLRWSDLPPGPIKDEVARMAERYGYADLDGVREEAATV
jgi:hypothetical protein